MVSFPPITPARRSEQVKYAVRDILLVAARAKAAGLELLHLNIGDPNLYDFATPPHVMEAICTAVRANKNSYSPSEGIPEALDAIRATAEGAGISAIRDIFIGTGASECIELALTSLLNEGDDVLTPSPGYPLYTAVLAKLGCPENPYFLDEESGWQPDLADIEAKITPRTKGIVLINPNNPTGSVCQQKTLKGLLELAARHKLVLFADEIYDRLVLDPDARHVSIAALRHDVPVLTFNGLSKAYLGPGLRIGWCISSGPEAVLRPYIEAMHKFLRARLCANHPIQHAIAPALLGDQSHIAEMCAKLRVRRDITVQMLNAAPGISCVPPRAAFYAFPRLEVGEPDAAFIPRLVEQTGVVVVHGSGFGQRPGTSHFRAVFLPPEPVLRSAYGRVAEYVQEYAQKSLE